MLGFLLPFVVRRLRSVFFCAKNDGFMTLYYKLYPNMNI